MQWLCFCITSDELEENDKEQVYLLLFYNSVLVQYEINVLQY